MARWDSRSWHRSGGGCSIRARLLPFRPPWGQSRNLGSTADASEEGQGGDPRGTSSLALQCGETCCAHVAIGFPDALPHPLLQLEAWINLPSPKRRNELETRRCSLLILASLFVRAHAATQPLSASGSSPTPLTLDGQMHARIWQRQLRCVCRADPKTPGPTTCRSSRPAPPHEVTQQANCMAEPAPRDLLLASFFSFLASETCLFSPNVLAARLELGRFSGELKSCLEWCWREFCGIPQLLPFFPTHTVYCAMETRNHSGATGGPTILPRGWWASGSSNREVSTHMDPPGRTTFCGVSGTLVEEGSVQPTKVRRRGSRVRQAAVLPWN